MAVYNDVTSTIDVQSLRGLVKDCIPYHFVFFSQEMKAQFLWVCVRKEEGIISLRGNNGVEC